MPLTAQQNQLLRLAVQEEMSKQDPPNSWSIALVPDDDGVPLISAGAVEDCPKCNGETPTHGALHPCAPVACRGTGKTAAASNPAVSVDCFNCHGNDSTGRCGGGPCRGTGKLDLGPFKLSRCFNGDGFEVQGRTTSYFANPLQLLLDTKILLPPTAETRKDWIDLPDQKSSKAKPGKTSAAAGTPAPKHSAAEQEVYEELFGGPRQIQTLPPDDPKCKKLVAWMAQNVSWRYGKEGIEFTQLITSAGPDYERKHILLHTNCKTCANLVHEEQLVQFGAHSNRTIFFVISRSLFGIHATFTQRCWCVRRDRKDHKTRTQYEKKACKQFSSARDRRDIEDLHPGLPPDLSTLLFPFPPSGAPSASSSSSSGAAPRRPPSSNSLRDWADRDWADRDLAEWTEKYELQRAQMVLFFACLVFSDLF